MDRLLRLEPSNAVVVRIEANQLCSGVLTLRNVMYTMPVAFRILPLNRTRFDIHPQTGIIAPLATLAVEITYLPPASPSSLLHEYFPESQEAFSLDSVVSPGALFKAGASATSLDAVPVDWFTAKKKQVFSDSALRVFYVGSPVLASLVQSGDMDKLREVLERSDPTWHAADSVDCRGETLLHLAISQARPDLVQLLLEFGADVEIRNHSGWSPLEAAAAAGDVLISELLLARGASTERSSAWGPIHHAASAGQVLLTKLLLSKGASVDETTLDGRTALHLAVEQRRRKCIAMLMSAGARAMHSSTTGDTPLHVASALGDEQTAKLLMENGCAGLREARNLKGKTAYDVAAEEGHMGLFDLLRAGERLAAAVRRGRVDEVARAIEMGASVDWKDGRGWTALMRAGFMGKLEVMKVLLDRGAVMDVRDEEGYTALHCAAEAGQAGAVEMLLKRGSNVEARTNKGRMAVEIAESLGYAGIVRILLQGRHVAAKASTVVGPTKGKTLPSPRGKDKVGKKGIKLSLPVSLVVGNGWGMRTGLAAMTVAALLKSY